MVQVFGQSFGRGWARVAAMLCFGLCVLVLFGGTPMSARSPERAVIRLGCDAPTAPLCRALVQELARRAPGRVIRQMAPGQETPNRPGDLGVRLELAQDGPMARLIWSTSTENMTQKAAWIHVTATQLPLSNGLSTGKARDLARALLEQNPSLLHMLTRAGLGKTKT